MKKLEFSNNEEMVKVATELLLDPKGYKYGRDCGTGLCFYRGEDNKRCIFGRLMYGRVAENSFFWDDKGTAIDAIEVYPEIRAACPWIDPEIADALQGIHDLMAQRTFEGGRIDLDAIKARLGNIQKAAAACDLSYAHLWRVAED